MLRIGCAPRPPRKPNLVATHYTETTLGLLGWWVDHDFCHDPDWLVRAWQTLALPGLRAALGVTDQVAALRG